MKSTPQFNRPLLVTFLGLLLACTGCQEPPRPADFWISPGVESVTVLDAEPSAPLTLYDEEGTPLVTLIADGLGQAHFAYVPAEYRVLDPSNLDGQSLTDGTVVLPGAGYVIQDDTTDPPNWSGTFSVLALDDVPAANFYEQQTLYGVPYSPLTGYEWEQSSGYQYIEMRDGVLLSAMVRFPDSLIYGEGPHPTVVTYSGYAPSRPDRIDSGALIANALGYATVSVNMRGSGCSGGVFDVFNRAQHADGYDIIETVARQDWALHGQAGMVGLSYPGISQLYVASTRPPSLAAIVPLSTIADAWEMQWPGGIYNAGFTRQWVEQREQDSEQGGSSWVTERIADGDSQCEENLKLSAHSVDFEPFFRGLSMRPGTADDRDLNLLIEQIEAPVYYGGSFQDEQTGAQFGSMLDRFHNVAALKVQLSNGRHPDGYSPASVYRWFEFLEFYLAERIPELNSLVRSLGSSQFGSSFGLDEVTFEDDRFTDFESYDAALEAYEQEPTVRVLFESGAAPDQPVGTPVARFEASYPSWPVDSAPSRKWFVGPEGQLLDSAPEPEGADSWRFDPEAGTSTFFGPAGYQLLAPLWDIDWTRFGPGDVASYVTQPFGESTVIAGPAIAELWVRSPVDDVMVQVTLTEVRPDDTEVLVQTGWLRLGHRAATEGEGLRLVRSYSEDEFDPVPVDEWVMAQVAIPSVAHAVRAGSSLRMSVSSPGRNHGTWEFETPDYEQVPSFSLGYGGLRASSLTMSTLPGIEIAEGLPPCPSLRGQPCRAYLPSPNVTAE
jgi:predicted acyl esterase